MLNPYFCLMAFSSFFAVSHAIPASCGPISVKTTRGTVVGCRYDYGQKSNASIYYGKGDVFLGIPFAQPPVGRLRFAVVGMFAA